LLTELLTRKNIENTIKQAVKPIFSVKTKKTFSFKGLKKALKSLKEAFFI